MARRLQARTLVARAAEVELIEEAACQAARGRGSVVVVRGEPGVGKTRLLAEAVRRSTEAGRPALVGRAVPGGGSFRPLADALLARQRTHGIPPPEAVQPFAPALSRLVPGWGPVTGGGGSVAVDEVLPLSEALVRLLRAVGRHHGALLALDDLHWADADTLAVVDRLVDAVEDAPVVLLLATRPEVPPVLERLTARAAAVIRLGRLSAGDTGQLLTACAEGETLPEHVHRHVVEVSEGLPLLVEELLADLVDAGALVRTQEGWSAVGPVPTVVPGSVASTVRRRLAALEASSRSVVEAAAVLGRRVDWRLLAPMTGLPEAAVLTALRAAADTGLLESDVDREALRFPHALVRDALLETLLPPLRVTLARTAAGLVEERGQDPVLAADLHEQGGNPITAARLLLATASAQENWGLGTREALLRRAAALAPDDDDVTCALVDVLAVTGRAVEATELGEPLLARLDPSNSRRVGTALSLARACLAAGRPQQAEACLGAAGRGPAVDAVAAHIAFFRQRPDDAERLARAAADAGEAAVRCEALEMLGRVARLRDLPVEAEAAFRQALSVAEEHALPTWRVRALHELGTLDLLGPARSDRLEAARELAAAAGMLGSAAVLDLQIAAVHNLRMEHAAGAEAARRCVELATALRLPGLVGTGLVFVATAQGHLGDTAAMHATLDRAEQVLRDDPDHPVAIRFARAVPLMLEHDLEAWAQALREGMQVIRGRPPASPSPYRGLHVLVETVLGGGDEEREELRRSGATVQACNRAALAYADAVAAGRGGDDPNEPLALAERVMEPLAWRRHHARLLVAPSALRDGWGDPIAWLREATGAFHAAGAEGLARACRALLREVGAPVPRAGRGVPAAPPRLARLGVSGREAEVLVLVAAGLTNVEIATRLFLSPRTVESHVASLLRKTGTARRTDLAALAWALSP